MTGTTKHDGLSREEIDHCVAFYGAGRCPHDEIAELRAEIGRLLPRGWELTESSPKPFDVGNATEGEEADPP